MPMALTPTDTLIADFQVQLGSVSSLTRSCQIFTPSESPVLRLDPTVLSRKSAVSSAAQITTRLRIAFPSFSGVDDDSAFRDITSLAT